MIDTMLYAIATEAYTMVVIGPTFNATFFISIFFMVEQIHQLLTGRQFIRKEYFILLILPLLSQVTVMLVTQLYKNPFYYPGNNLTAFYLRPLYFYFKTYIPLFAVGAKIVQDREDLSFELFAASVMRIACISCCIACFQLLVVFVFHDQTLGEILGLQHRYMIREINGLLGVRVQAFFSEPKILSAFLSLSVPLFFNARRFIWASVAIIMGVLTSSQTFWINILAAALLFPVFARLHSVRLKILCTLASLVGLFLLVAASRNQLLEHFAANRDNEIYAKFFERSIDRYDNEYWQKDNVILGIPLQRDLELPVVDFLKDEPYLLLSGYGAGNSTFIPSAYFFGQQNYANHVAGIGGHNLNMRWFFILAEFGAISLVFFFLILTRTDEQLSAFNKDYLAYVAICFFFSQIDLFLVIIALLSAYGVTDNKYIYGKDVRHTGRLA